jgi:hypothetical protein
MGEVQMGTVEQPTVNIRTIKALKPGLTELVFHPSRNTRELQAITDTWQLRRFEYDVFRDKENP